MWGDIRGIRETECIHSLGAEIFRRRGWNSKVSPDTADEKERNKTVHNSGIRWSELFCLPYFNTSCFVVIDAMHNLFLGLVQEHFDILGIKLNNTKSNMTPSIIINIPEESINKLNEHEHKSVSHLINMLGAPIAKELKSQASYNLYFK